MSLCVATGIVPLFTASVVGLLAGSLSLRRMGLSRILFYWMGSL
jgi:hypothetical protein